jgi:PilZ domain
VLADRRCALRYHIASSISVEDSPAVTENVSSMGVYFVTDRPLTADQEVLLVFAFDHAAPETRVTCNGRIVRVERRPGGFGVAATYEAIGFEIGTKDGA